MGAIVRSTRMEVVRDAIRQSLRDGFYTCGERLVESRIAQEMSVSQNTVRDALRLLEAEGWVTYQARQGVSVRAFTANEAEEIYALWANVEQLAFRWATTEHNRVELLNVLRVPIEQARRELDLGRWTATRQLLFDFHALVSSLANRPRTETVLAMLRNQAYLMDMDYEVQAITPVEERAQRVETYANLLGVIKFGELDAAEKALHAHISDEGRRIIRWLAMNE